MTLRTSAAQNAHAMLEQRARRDGARNAPSAWARSTTPSIARGAAQGTGS